EAVAGAGIVVTCLPNGEVVRTAWLADDGVVASAKPGTSLVELSTIGQSDMLAVARPATETGLRVLDCAVSGSPAQARNGELTLIVGAADDDLAAVTPVLRDIGSTLQHVGAVGMGKVVKLVNNLMAMG